MYKTIRMPIRYDDKLVESFEKALESYDMAYKHATCWYYSEADCVKEFLEDEGADPFLISNATWIDLPDKYFGYKC